MIGTPRVQGSILAEYHMPTVQGLSLMGGINYTSNRTTNTTGTHSVSGFTTMDLGVRYDQSLMGKNTSWRLGVNNVTNNRYWSSVFIKNGINGDPNPGSASSFLGAPREVHTSVTMEF